MRPITIMLHYRVFQKLAMLKRLGRLRFRVQFVCADIHSSRSKFISHLRPMQIRKFRQLLNTMLRTAKSAAMGDGAH